METSLTSEHLEIAKTMLRQKFLIGKVDEIGESFNRFKIYFGWKNDISFCEEQVLTSSKLKDYSRDLNSHELNLSYDNNSLDVQL